MARYIADPNNNKKQIPAPLNITEHTGRAETPVTTVISHRPNYVIINQTGSYAFAYQSGSISTYVTGSVIKNISFGPIRLDINPVAWRQTSTAGTLGDITFVYTGNVG